MAFQKPKGSCPWSLAAQGPVCSPLSPFFILDICYATRFIMNPASASAAPLITAGCQRQFHACITITYIIIITKCMTAPTGCALSRLAAGCQQPPANAHTCTRAH
eukprot:703184-Pelagomonas_calceolata.AAC.2